MCKYIFCCPCEFKHGINIDQSFIGKKIPIKILGFYGFTSFPIIKSNEKNGSELINPNLDNIIGEYKCGDYSSSFTPSGKPIIRPRITRVYFTLYIDEDIENINQFYRKIIQEIERLASKFIKCISIIHPSAIRWSYTKEEGYIKPIESFSLVNTITNKDEGIAAFLNIHITSPSEVMTIDEFFKIYRNINRDISLQYTLLADTKRCLVRGEYREVVLNCATIIEKTLKDQVISYLDQEQTGEKIKRQILKHANGFSKIQEIMKTFGLPQANNSNIIKTHTIDIRDKVIHKGNTPSKQQAEQAIRDAKQIIKEYNVSIFV
jgi:HEPN domain-containing protein